MSNINGTSPLDFEVLIDKTQNIDELTTNAGTTNVLGLLEVNGVPVSVGGGGPFLPLSGSPPNMTGDLNLGTHNLVSVGSLNGISISDLFLRTGAVAMTGDLNMNVHEIKGLVAIRPNDSNVNIGNTTTLALGGIANIVIGDFSQTTSNFAVCIGAQNIARSNAIAIGYQTVAGTNATVVGYRSSNGINTDTLIFGHDNVSSGGANADIFGVNRTNNQANTLLLGNGSYVNIRANNTCDLGTAAIPFQSAYFNGSLNGPTNTRTIDNIVSTASTGVSGDVVIFLAGKVVQDSGVLLSSLATTASLSTYVQGPASAVTTNLAAYNGTTGKLIQDSAISTADVFLRTGAVIMTGNFNANSNNLINVNNILTSGTTINFGNTNTVPINSSVCVGSNNNITGTGGGLSIVYGANNNLGATPNGQSIVFGNGNTDGNGAGGTFIYGFGNSNGTGQRNILIGRNNVVPNGVDEAHVFGFAGTNSTSHSVLFNNASVNIRGNGTNICDLGVSGTGQFNSLYANFMRSTGAISIGDISATSVTLARAAINTNVGGPLVINGSIDSANIITIGNTNAPSITLGRLGIITNVNSDLICNVNSIFATTINIGTWYCSTTYNPTFTAGVNRLTPPTTVTTGTLVNVGYSAGILTYVGTRTRTFRINFNITITSGASGSNMTFFISKNGSTTIGTQSQIRQQIFVQDAGTQMSLYISDLVTLAQNDTIQLAGACAISTVGVAYNFVSCQISNLSN